MLAESDDKRRRQKARERRLLAEQVDIDFWSIPCRMRAPGCRWLILRYREGLAGVCGNARCRNRYSYLRRFPDRAGDLVFLSPTEEEWRRAREYILVRLGRCEICGVRTLLWRRDRNNACPKHSQMVRLKKHRRRQRGEA
jgi:hypothetical protein